MKKKFGQNFLRDKNLLKKIVDSALIKDKDVIEIGPGMGALTTFLIEQAKSLVAYEVDLELEDFLRNLEQQNSNFKVVFKDILKVDLSGNNEMHVVANIPYNITSPIIFKIIESKNIKSATLMVQKEVCDRILASPGTKDYNALSIIIQYFMDVKRVVNVSKKMFYPVPKVDSAVFRMVRKEKTLEDREEELFLSIVKASFHQKRKTISNNLSFGFNLDKSELNDFLDSLNIDSNLRAETISGDKFIEIAKKWPFNKE